MAIAIHKAIGKLPIIPKRGFVLPNMHYCGAYNPLNKQLIYDENGNILRYIQKPTGKTDEICAQHDVDYTLANDLQDKHVAAEKMIKSIDNLPYKDQQYGTFLVKNIIKSKRELGLGNNPNQILSQELHQQRKINFTRRKVISNHIDRIWGIDLITMIKYSKQNKNYKYILKVIDFFSKYSWCHPLKTKKSEEIINSFKDIFKKSKRKPKLIQSDEGSEFKNIQTHTFFKNNNIKWYHTYNRGIKCSICERYNRNILNVIYKNFTLNNNTIWINDLYKLVNEYNNSYHRSIKMKPIDASKKLNENIVRNNLYNFKITNKKPKFSIGDKVRVSLLKNTFEKSYTSN